MTNMTQGMRLLAESAALAAGKSLIDHQKEWARAEKHIGKDVKVKGDLLAENLILELLSNGSSFKILTEESGWKAGESDEYCWVVDPLDGSFNYHQGIPMCAVSIALIHHDKPVIGVIYDFNHHELFSGEIGVGAWLNHQPMSVSSIKEKSQSVLNTGLPVARDNSLEAMQMFGKKIQGWRKVRMLGSAAIAIAYVAAGRAEVYMEESSRIWDVAAGVALVEAAGGTVELEIETLDKPVNTNASNGLVKY